ncbi:MAG: phospholipase D-like domain-containing protein [Nitrospirae bacterium]|nr:phospholipase D-like domain-containing protein [Nitrospirota bacterium]MDA8215675.1 phospholipase D-like domain-containing protein [Nitrospiraceae bacterium]
MSDTFTTHSIEKLFRGKFSTATNIQLLWKGDESFKTIFDAIKSAEELICLEFYIFRNDETGTELSELLKQKSREGIKVYLLYDHFGSFGTPRSFWKDMKKAGIKIRASRPFKWTAPFNYVHRDHKKLIVIDSQLAFTGGLNIANEYSGFHLRLKGRSWRDTGIMLKGPIVGELFNIFKKSWYLWGGEPITISNFKFQILNFKEAIPAIPIFVASARGRRRMRRLLYYSINHSQKNISLATAYFTPSRRMVETLEGAVKRGVKVRLLVPGISDVPAASYAGKAFFSRLLKAGVEIYNYMGEILHAKTYIFDDCWSIIGSTNLDFQSLRYNDEGNVGILDVDFVSKINKIFEEDLKYSIKIELAEWHKRPLKEKLKEHFFSIFRRRL